MEPTNLHQLQDQQQLEASSTSTPSCYVVGSSHSWTPATTLDAGNFKPNLNSSVIQDLGYHHWRSDAETCLTNKDMSERHLLKALFQGDLNSTSAQSYPSYGGKGVPSRGNFSQIYPSINISNLNHSSPSPAISSMQYSNQLTSTTQSHSGNWSQCTSQDHGLGEFTENLFCGLDQMQYSTDRSSSCNNSSNPSHFTNGMVETKRPSTLMESSKASQSQIASKKSRPESRSSCQPLKVRKEKLGDRIAALQQLVAPFGKTDTASVLMEAIGYITFLQSQVETLSVPYMKSSRNQTNRVRQEGSATDGKNSEPKQDLRSRGLCLVPSSCMMYLAIDGGSGAWQPPNFGGTT